VAGVGIVGALKATFPAILAYGTMKTSKAVQDIAKNTDDTGGEDERDDSTVVTDPDETTTTTTTTTEDVPDEEEDAFSTKDEEISRLEELIAMLIGGMRPIVTRGYNNESASKPFELSSTGTQARGGGETGSIVCSPGSHPEVRMGRVVCVPD
jgi:hypothetical protein